MRELICPLCGGENVQVVWQGGQEKRGCTACQFVHWGDQFYSSHEEAAMEAEAWLMEFDDDDDCEDPQVVVSR